MTIASVTNKMKKLSMVFTITESKGGNKTVKAQINGQDVEFSESNARVISFKNINDESDSMSDYCAWGFVDRVKDLDWIAGR